ncbi:hypothetical protein ES708_34104 [subsurface metagenome]
MVTSPPFWGLRDYGIEPVTWDGDKDCKHEWGNKSITLKHKPGETNPGKESWFKDRGASDDKGNCFCLKCDAWRGSLGLEPTFELYVKHLCDIFDGVKRVLRKDGTCWVNLGDTYASSPAGNKEIKYSGDGVYGRLMNRHTQGGTSEVTYKPKKYSVPTKSLCLIPQRFAIEIHRPQHHGKDINYGKQGRNKRTVWIIPTKSFPEAHFAVYPETLIEPMIKAGCPEFVCKKCGKARVKILEPTEEYKKLLNQSWTEDTDKDKKLRKEIGFQANTKKVSCTADYRFKGYTDCGCNAGFEPGVVLDPFMGAGTTALVALKQRKRFIGIEIKREYIDMSYKRIARVQQRIF